MANANEIVKDAGRVLDRQRYERGSIGERSRALKAGHWGRKAARAAMAVFALLVAATLAGIILDGIGFAGVMLLAITAIVAVGTLMTFPKMKPPTPQAIQKANLATLAGKTEIWLEAQRPALPAPALPLIDGIGMRLDMLSPQLATLGEGDPAAHEVRRLVGEHLPELIDGYRRIPEPLRKEAHGGSTPEEQLLSGLASIDREIESMTRTIASGELDKLATRSRYLELKYDGDGAGRE